MTLAHDTAGSGPAVVLLHSTVADRRMWDPQLPALISAGYRPVRCDLRGFGQTPMPDRSYNDAQDVADLLDLLDIERAAFVASSGGGRVALEFAARWPERVTSLMLLCTAMAGHEPSAELKAFGDREDELLEAGAVAEATEFNVATWAGPHLDAATRDKVRDMQRHAFEVQLAAAEEFAPIKVEADAQAITAPCLLVSGGHDLVDFREIAAHLATQIAGARHLDLPWAGHLPSLERPDALNQIMIDFLESSHAAPH